MENPLLAQKIKSNKIYQQYGFDVGPVKNSTVSTKKQLFPPNKLKFEDPTKIARKNGAKCSRPACRAAGDARELQATGRALRSWQTC